MSTPTATTQTSTTPPTTSVPNFQQTVTYIDWVIAEDARPVVRIFGSTPAGQKSLLHLHNCFPYLYCDIPMSFPQNEFVVEIRHRLEIFLKGDKPKSRSRVYQTSVEKNKIPVYGFAEPRDVCKVQLYDPGDVRRVCEYLMGESIRVYNANVGYLLQVMVDLDLAGMDMITCSKFCFRGPLPPPSNSTQPLISAVPNSPLDFRWSSETPLPDEYIMEGPRRDMPFETWWAHASRPAKTSSCELELDVNVDDVITFKPDPPKGSLADKRIKFVKSLGAWWMAEENRRKAENFASDFDKQEEEEENNHINSDASFVEDPFRFRRRLARIARKMRAAAAKSESQNGEGVATQVEFRRSQTQSDFLRSPQSTGRQTTPPTPEAKATAEDEGDMDDAQFDFSQETIDTIKIINSWKQDQPKYNDEQVSSSSPSQMTDDELLNGPNPIPHPGSSHSEIPSTARKTVRFASDTVHPGSDDSLPDDDADDDEEEEDDSGNMWEDILASQKDFVEYSHNSEDDDQLDGGVFLDDEEEVEENDNDFHVPTPPTPALSVADSVEEHDDIVENDIDMKVQPPAESFVDLSTPTGAESVEVVINHGSSFRSGNEFTEHLGLFQCTGQDQKVDTRARELSFVVPTPPTPERQVENYQLQVSASFAVPTPPTPERLVEPVKVQETSSLIGQSHSTPEKLLEVHRLQESSAFVVPTPPTPQSKLEPPTLPIDRPFNVLTRPNPENIVSFSSMSKSSSFMVPTPPTPERPHPRIGEKLKTTSDGHKQIAQVKTDISLVKSTTTSTAHDVHDDAKASMATPVHRDEVPNHVSVVVEDITDDDAVAGEEDSWSERERSNKKPRMRMINDDIIPTTFVYPSREAPLPVPSSAMHCAQLQPVKFRGLYYSDPKDVPKRTAEEFHNIHLDAPKSLLDSIPSAGFRPFSLEYKLAVDTKPKGIKRTRWVEPRHAAPVPTGFPTTVKTSKAAESTKIQIPSSSSSMLPPPPPPPSGTVPFSRASTATTSSNSTTSPVKIGAVSQLSQASSLSHATPGNPVTGNQKKVSLRTALEKNPENNNLTLFGMEIFARNRSTAAGREGKGKPFSLIPDPQHDPIVAIFYCVRDDQRDERFGKGRGTTDEFGMMYVKPSATKNTTTTIAESDESQQGDSAVPDWFGLDLQLRNSVEVFSDEMSMIHALVNLIRRIDADVIMGWEVQKDSLGYLLQRAKVLGEPNLPRLLSRVPYGQQDRRHENDEWGNAEHSGFWIAGRHIFNLWRVCREELKLYTYTIGNVLFQLTGDKLPKYAPSVLTGWWDDSANTKFLVVNHFKKRVLALLKICDHLDILGRNCELARLFGMDLFSVMTRGSQFRVEAVLLRVCKGLGYLMLSPTRKNVASQPAMEAVPLIFEPKSAFYAYPVLVLDFRSLYPSVIIANNICFSTCLGRLKPNVGGSTATSTVSSSAEEAVQTREEGEEEETSEESANDAFIPGLGVDSGYSPPLPLLTRKEDYGFVSPNGVCFVSKKRREGVLPRMLREILDTRVMIKKSVDGPDVEESKRRVADARQFGLKMIANVTYGYTAASFSGRMPCAEIADAIVQTGRACLELAIKIVHDRNAPWYPAECVYGDTDSLFVHLPGRDLEQARKIGKEISEKVSQSLPKPMKLQFEKVFFPCVLEVKKRYVGWKFPSKAPVSSSSQSPEEEKGTLDAKGIETIRRDGCAAVVKTMESTLKEMFTSRDLSKVKAHLKQEFEKMFSGTVSMSQFIISGKVKLGSYAKDRKKTGNYPPAAVVADKMMKRDPRAKPVYKERVSYVVACGPPGSRLIDLVVDPHELLMKNLRVNVAHYVDKLILPALDRLLSCASVDVKSWFSFEKTRNLWGGWRRRLNTQAASSNMIHRFFDTTPCVLCSKPSVAQQQYRNTFSAATSAAPQALCAECASDMQRARYTADIVCREAESRAKQSLRVCSQCVVSQCDLNPGKSQSVANKRNSSNKRIVGPGSSILFAGAGEMCLNLDCEDFYTRRRAVDRVIFDIETLGRIGGGDDDDDSGYVENID